MVTSFDGGEFGFAFPGRCALHGLIEISEGVGRSVALLGHGVGQHGDDGFLIQPKIGLPLGSAFHVVSGAQGGAADAGQTGDGIDTDGRQQAFAKFRVKSGFLARVTTTTYLFSSLLFSSLVEAFAWP